MLDLTTLPFIPSADSTFTRGPVDPERTIKWIVIHTVDDNEGQVRHVALHNARFFERGADGEKASAHFFVDGGDDQPAIHTVQLKDIANGAPGANQHGVHIEHAGDSGQSAENWQTEYAKTMLELSAQITAAVCNRCGVPAVWLSPEDLRAGNPGITSHNNVTIAFKAQFPRASHTDPGPNFPAEHYVARVQEILDAG